MLDSIAVAFDLPILDWIQANLQSPFLDKFMPFITGFGGHGGLFWISIAVILLIIPKTRKTGLGIGFALIFGLLGCNIILKPLTQRTRPYDLQATFGVVINLLVKAETSFSFPSGHTIASFEAATVLMRNDKRMGIPALILACLIACSRLYLYVHYPTDVLVAVVLGVAFGILGDMLAGKLLKTAPTGKGKYLKQ